MSEEQPKPPTILQIIKSVLSAMFGVQKNANRERDFTKGDFKTFALVGVILTTLFIIGLLVIVNLVLKNIS